MEYIYKQYEVETKKKLTDKKVITISDLHLTNEVTRYELNDLLLKINDILPQYIFILGDIFAFQYLEDAIFKKNILYFLNTLTKIGKTYLVFGNHDYLYKEKQKNFFIEIDKLLNFYQKTNIQVITNNLIEEDDMNIIGYNKFPLYYKDELKDISKLREEINSLMGKINDVLKQEKFSIFLTHSHLDLLKLQIKLLQSMDLILAGHTHNGLVPNFLEGIFPENRGIITAKKLFQRNTRGYIENEDQILIVNGGITKISKSHSTLLGMLNRLYPGEIDIIKVKSLSQKK